MGLAGDSEAWAVLCARRRARPRGRGRVGAAAESCCRSAGGSNRRSSFIVGVALAAVAVGLAVIAIGALVNGRAGSRSPSYNNLSTQGEPSEEMAESIASVYADAYAFTIAEGDSKEDAESYAQFYTTNYHILGREHFGYSHDSALVFADRVDDKLLSFFSNFIRLFNRRCLGTSCYLRKSNGFRVFKKRADDIEIAIHTLILEGYESSLEQVESIADAAVTAYGAVVERGESGIFAYIAAQDAVRPLMASGLPTK